MRTRRWVWLGAIGLAVLLPVLGRARDRAMCEWARTGQALRVRTLLALGAPPDARDDDDRSALLCAVRASHGDMLQAFLRRGASPNARDPRTHETAMMIAARHGDLQSLRLLLRYHGDPNARSWAGESALTVAVRSSVAAAKLLLQNGADPNARGPNGAPPLVMAARALTGGDYYEYSDGDGEDYSGSSSSTRAVMSALLDAGANPNLAEPNGRDALSYALQAAEPDTIDLLLRHGADPGVRTGSRAMPLLRPALLGSAADLVARIRNGADVDATDPATGMTALHAAALMGRANAVRVLLSNDGDPNVRAAGNRATPLLLALQHDRRGAAMVLARTPGVDLNTLDDGEEQCPLIVAIQRRQTAIARAMVARGASLEPLRKAVSRCQ